MRASFPRAGCGKSACPVRRAGRGNSTKPNRTEVTLRESAVNYHRETKVTAPLLDSTYRIPSRFECYLCHAQSMEILSQLFEQRFGHAPTRVVQLQGELGGSGRKIIRLSDGQQSAIGILHGVREENAAFLAFSRHFRRHGLPVPEIYGENLDQGAYLEQDLGSTTLFDFLASNRPNEVIAPAVIEAYRKVVAVLPRFQVDAASDFDYSL